MHTEPRTRPIGKVVVHVNVGPEVEGGAAALVRYLQTIQGGYHAVCDDTETIVTAADTLEVWGNGGINSTSLDVCIIGYADQTAEQWADPYSSAAIHQAAVWTAGKCKAYAIPVVRLTPQQVATRGVKGVCGHVDVSAAGYPGSAGHYDPGPQFPWPHFLSTVATLVNPPPSSNPLAALAKALGYWRVKRGDRGYKVRRVQRLLVKHHLPLIVNGVYDQNMAAAVLRFKKAHGLKNRNPDAVGVAMLSKLIQAPKVNP